MMASITLAPVVASLTCWQENKILTQPSQFNHHLVVERLFLMLYYIIYSGTIWLWHEIS